MRKRSSTIPDKFTIISTGNEKAIVLLRENVRYISDNEIEFDEYTISLPKSENLAESIKNNIRAWITYARRMESRPNSSAEWHLQEHHDEELAAMVREILIENVALNATVSALEDALCEIDESNEERIAAIEDALCELDKEEME